MNTKKLYKKILLFCAILGFSFILTIFTSYYTKSYRGVVGNVCEVTIENPRGWCYENLPMGGFPFIYLKDDPSTSVVGHLSFVEDEVFLDKFFLDWWFYLIVSTILYYLYNRVRQTDNA